MLRTLGAIMLATAISPGAAWAQIQIDEQRPAAPSARIEIENMAGSVRVVGWDQELVKVTGTLGAEAEGLDFDGSRDRIEIEVEFHGHPTNGSADLEVFVPSGSALEIEGFAADIDVAKVTGSVEASTVNGSIGIDGAASEVNIETVNGNLEVSGPASRVTAESINGTVKILGSSGEVGASTVNGALVVEGGSFERAGLETVNGQIRFDGALVAGGALSVESVGGSVVLVLPNDISADFSIATFSGEIVNEFGPEAVRTSRWTSEKELRFSTGSGGARVNVETLSGTVTLKNK